MTFSESGGSALFSLTAAGYAGALANYVASLGSAKVRWQRLATGLALFGLVVHTLFLAHRYAMAGLTEIATREARGETVAGMDRFWTYVMHPPYTNLFESLMFVTWIIMLAYAFMEWRWKLRPLGVVATALTLAGLAEAYIVVEKDVRPLVPALQSKWILIHVGMIFVSYALFLLAAVVGVFFLLKDRIPLARLGVVFLPVSAVVTLLAGGAKSLLTRAAFEVTPLGMADEKLAMSGKIRHVWTSVRFLPPGADKPQRFWITVPGVGPIVLVAVLALLAAGWLWWKEHRSGRDEGVGGIAFRATLAALGLLTAALGLLVGKLATATPFDPKELDPSLASVQFVNELPFRLSVGSNYALGLLAVVWLGLALFVGLSWRRDQIAQHLPDPRRLDDMIYKLVIFSFPLLSIGIVLGGMWAAAAWGRFWGWDPKETWALITWAVYAVYLHVRITYGPGRMPSAIAVFAFGVVLFTYMGVNLGLTGEGLHVYGQG